jgi:hypothetical protein
MPARSEKKTAKYPAHPSAPWKMPFCRMVRSSHPIALHAQRRVSQQTKLEVVMIQTVTGTVEWKLTW